MANVIWLVARAANQQNPAACFRGLQVKPTVCPGQLGVAINMSVHARLVYRMLAHHLWRMYTGAVDRITSKVQDAR